METIISTFAGTIHAAVIAADDATFLPAIETFCTTNRSTDLSTYATSIVPAILPTV
jgi:hypothetical protein